VPAATVFNNATKGALSSASTQFVDGLANATFTAGTTSASCGNGGADATADNQVVNATVAIQCPDFTITKANTVGNATVLGQSWQWQSTISNASGDLSTTANFANGQIIFTDTMPATNMTYGSPTISNSSGVTGTVSCSWKDVHHGGHG
jgi:hypothetical protein